MTEHLRGSWNITRRKTWSRPERPKAAWCPTIWRHSLDASLRVKFGRILDKYSVVGRRVLACKGRPAGITAYRVWVPQRIGQL